LTVYWLLFLIPGVTTFISDQRVAGAKREGWILIWILMVAAIGFRHEIGCDWEPYLTMFSIMGKVSFRESLDIVDPGYAALTWIVNNVFDGDIYVANLLSGALFATGLIMFVRRQPTPSMALATAVPYLVVVVAMGYTRQSIAIGFVFWALSRLPEGKVGEYLLLVSIGALFHKSAVVMLPLGMMAVSQNRTWVLLITPVLVATLGYALLADHYEALWSNYVENEMSSEGGFLRVFMNVVPAVFMFSLWKRFKAAYPTDARIWYWIGLLSIACIPFLAVASTAVDRVALYFTPIQVAVISRLPELSRNSFAKPIWRLSALLLYAAVLWVWLVFGIHARMCWLPYRTPWF
jgi:hypothetical protein